MRIIVPKRKDRSRYGGPLSRAHHFPALAPFLLLIATDMPVYLTKLPANVVSTMNWRQEQQFVADRSRSAVCPVFLGIGPIGERYQDAKVGYTCESGDTVTVPVRVHNYADRSVKGTLRFSGTESRWEFSPDSVPFEVEAGEHFQTDFTVQVVATGGRFPLVVRVDTDAPGYRIAPAVIRLQIKPRRGAENGTGSMK